MLVVKLLARLIEIALMAVIALIGIGIGLYCLSELISLGSARPDRLVDTPAIRDDVGSFLDRIAAPGPTAVIAVICGAAALVIALLLVVGLLGSRRERLLVLDRDSRAGDLAVRPRPVTLIARAETEAAAGVTGTRRPKLKLRRDGTRGRLKIRARRGFEPDAQTVDGHVHARVDPIADALHLKTDVRVRLHEPKEVREARPADQTRRGGD